MDYFEPLRRKIGALTLVAACVLIVGWSRSLNQGDVFCIRIDKQLYSIQSSNGALRCIKENDILTIEADAAHPLHLNGMTLTGSLHIEFGPLPWWQSFRAYDGPRSGLPASIRDNAKLLFCPYWCVVSPLILLSAWLLLSRPRAKPKSTGNIS